MRGLPYNDYCICNAPVGKGDEDMPQNVLVSVLGEGEYLPRLVHAFLEEYL